jgi:hypothetical protein
MSEVLAGRAVAEDRRAQGLQDYLARLRAAKAPADHQARVVLEEDDEVEAAVLTLEDEGEEVRLPTRAVPIPASCTSVRHLAVSGSPSA